MWEVWVQSLSLPCNHSLAREGGKTIAGQMLKLGLETWLPWEFSGITQFNAFKTWVSLCLCSPATKWEQWHCAPSKKYERANPSMCTDTYSCDQEQDKHYLQNKLTHVPTSGVFVVWLLGFFSLSFPQSTRHCWLLPRSSWARTAAAVLLLGEVILSPESQEGRSSVWWVLPATQHSSPLPLVFKLKPLNLYPYFFLQREPSITKHQKG